MRAAPSSARPRIRLAARVSILLVCVLVLVCLVRWQATLNWMGEYLVATDALEHADLIVVMGGDFWGPRVVKGAELVKQGFAPLVLISGPPYNGRPEGEFAVDFLVQHGYARDLFAVFGHHEPNTFGEVLVLRGELARRRAKRVIIVTTSYHSRRCKILFRLLCPGIRFVSEPAPDEHYHADEWWNDPPDRDLLLSEWTKILGSIFVAYPSYEVSHWMRRS